jgi:hypothetical protein
MSDYIIDSGGYKYEADGISLGTALRLLNNLNLNK